MNITKELKRVLRVQSYSYEQENMFNFIIEELTKIQGVQYYEDNGNIYALKGEAVNGVIPCIVSHMDTVHPIVTDLSVIEIDGKLTGINKHTMKQTGIGGDDKVGVFICLESLRNFDNMKVAFFCDEEVGCIGSGVADMDFFNDCSFVLQCDRKGNSDFVTCASGVKLSSKAFQNDVKPILKQYGYKFAEGMMTDVMTLKENYLPCSCANISCGYYNPHTAQEYVNTKDVLNCLSLVFAIFSRLGAISYPHQYSKPVRPQSGFKWSKNGQKRGVSDFMDGYGFSCCENCGLYEPKYKLTNGLCEFCTDSLTPDTMEYCLGCDKLHKRTELSREGICKECVAFFGGGVK